MPDPAPRIRAIRLDAVQPLSGSTVRLEDALSSCVAEAAVLRANGQTTQATSIERVCAKVSASASAYLEWVSERDAALRSGSSAGWFRSRFSMWQVDGLAELRGRQRYYRAVIVPRKVRLSLVRSAAALGVAV